jgi:soluble lytic murein transglycosylase-like protein
MPSTRPAALRVALKTMVCAALGFALLLSLAPAAGAARSQRAPCANRLCTKDRPHTRSCYRRDGRSKIARCFIARAAAHYRQSRRRANHIAWRESRYNWRVTNSSSGAAGLYQFMRSTWKTTPYRRYSPYNPRMASLAAMWMWAHGGYSHWR